MIRCPICTSGPASLVFTYTAPPTGEVRYHFNTAQNYYRTILQCEICGHFVSRHNMEEGALYTSEYVDATYQDTEGLIRAFERIIALDKTKSDNEGRANRVLAFASRHFATTAAPSILDVGSGLCVFLYRMKAAGWECTALDPDLRAARHASERVGVKSICADFRYYTSREQFDVITFNKMLEHVIDPVTILAKAKKFLKSGGFVYVEVPDGELAAADGPTREEFFIDHHHVFSTASLAILAMRAGFTVCEIERLHEPSTKYTLRAFLV